MCLINGNSTTVDVFFEAADVLVIRPQEDFLKKLQTAQTVSCSAKCRNVHKKLLLIIEDLRYSNAPGIYNEFCKLLNKSRRKMSFVCFQDLHELTKDLIKTPQKVEYYLCARDRLSTITLDLKNLDIGENRIRIHFDRGNIVGRFHYTFDSFNNGKSLGMLSEEKILLMQINTKKISSCSCFCEMVHKRFRDLQENISIHSNFDTYLAALSDILRNGKGLMNAECYYITKKNLNELIFCNTTQLGGQRPADGAFFSVTSESV
jgi:hypothetical protein